MHRTSALPCALRGVVLALVVACAASFGVACTSSTDEARDEASENPDHPASGEHQREEGSSMSAARSADADDLSGLGPRCVEYVVQQREHCTGMHGATAEDCERRLERNLESLRVREGSTSTEMQQKQIASEAVCDQALEVFSKGLAIDAGDRPAGRAR